MIDVVFQLMIFFLVATKLDEAERGFAYARSLDQAGAFATNLSAIAGLLALGFGLLAFVRFSPMIALRQRLMFAAFSGIFLPSIAMSTLFERQRTTAETVLFAMGAAQVLIGLCGTAAARVSESRYGRALACIRQNETRARFLGYPVWACKFSIFVVSCAIAGLAGALFAMAQQSAYPNVMSLHQSGFVVMMVLVGGGLVSFWGPIVGAAFFILARDLLGAYTETWLFWYGLVFMALVLFKPEGLAGIGRDLAARWRARGAKAA